MSEEGGGKIKSKRGSSQSKPYERRKSLLGKVTETLKEVIAPSWLSDLVNSVRKTSPKKEDEEHMQQNVMNPVPSQSQNLKPGYPRDGLSQSMPQKFVPLSTNSNGIPRLSHRSIDPTHPSKPPFTAVNKPDDNPSCAWLTPQNQNISSTEKHTDDGQTKGLANCERPKLHHIPEQKPSTDRGLGGLAAEQPKESVNEEVTMNCNHDQTAVEDISRLEKSATWSERFSKRSMSLRSKPGFDVSLFSSPMTNNFHSKSFHESMFYPGKTSFGGASSRRSQLNMTAPYETSFPIRQKMKVKPSSSSASAATSSNAKKILETLEKLSTPLSDAKKIPVDDTVLRLSHFSPGSFSRRTSRYSMGSYLDSRRELLTPEKGPPKSKVSTPTAALISKNYQKTSFVDKKSESFSQEPAQFMQKSAGPPVGGGGKVKEKKFSQHIPGRKAVEIDEEVEIPDLRTDFTLNVKEMPKFNFSNDMELTRSKTVLLNSEETMQKKSDVQFTFSSPIQKTPTKEQPQPKSLKTNFTFSSPLDVNSSSAKAKSVTFNVKSDDKTASQSPQKGFQFGSPVNAMTMPNSTLGASPVLPSAGHATFKPSSELKTGSVMDILRKPSDSDLGGFKPASQLKQGSVMDVLGKSNSLGDFKPAMELNKDNAKSVTNENSDSGSFGCLKPASELKTGSVMDVLGKTDTSTTSSLSTLFKPEAGSWECDTCMIKNKADVTKCLACQTAKPSKVPSSVEQKSLSNMFKPDPGSWKCDVCLINNKSDVSKCVACQTSKPLSVATSKACDNGQSGFGNAFKMAAGSWNCDVCMVNNKSEVTKCVACQANKPGTEKSKSSSTEQQSLSSMFKSDPGSWSCDVCLVKNTANSSVCVACQTKKPGSDTAKSSKENSFTSKFKKPEGAWECDTCLVPNKAEATKCIACTTPRPGLQSSSFAGGFKFGSSSSSFSGQKGFVFGNVSSNTDSSEKQSDTTNKTSSDSASSFKFGNIATSDSSSKANDIKFGSSDNQSGFKFGTSSKTEDSNSKTNNFKFGSTDSSGSATTGGFQFGVPSNVTTTVSDNTIKPVSIPSVVTNLSDKKTTFSEDVNKDPKPSVGFQFGVSDKNSASSTEGFNGTNSVTSAFKFGDTETSTATSGFKFGVQESGESAAKTSVAGKGELSEASASTFKSIFGVDKSEIQSCDEQAIPNQPSSTRFGSGAGFAFGTVASTGGFGGVSTTKQEVIKPFSVAEQPASFNFQSSTSQKRSLDSDDGPTDAKKAFSFGTTNPSNPIDKSGLFKMNSTTSTSTTSAAPFNMAQNSTSGGISSTETPSAGGFNFGQPGAGLTSTFGSKPTAAASTGGFTFGAQASTEKPAAPTFNFGGTGTTSAPPMFGTNTSNTTPVTAAAPAPASAFVFGQPSNNQGAAAAPFSFTAQSATNQTPAATFGAPQSTNASTTPAFGSSSNSFGGASFAPAFGSSTPSGFGAGSTPAPAPSPFGSAGSAPGFGNPAPVTTSSNFTFNSTPSFNFGANPAAAPATNGPGVFQFGKAAENASSAAPQVGATGGFSFGQSQSVPTAGAFNFNASSSNMGFGAPPPTGPGTFTIGSTSNSDRKIKKAVRKIRR